VDRLDRRKFLLAASAAGAAASAARAEPRAGPPLIETTVHLYDPKRPQGAPYHPDPEGVSGDKVRARAPAGVVGAIAVECSPWIEDNLWLLEACQASTFMVGCVGNLRPESREFSQFVERFNKHPLYLGIRHGKLWGYNLPEQMHDPAFVAGLKVLADADLVIDLANPDLELLQAAVRINDAVPNLRIVVDHLAGYYPAAEEHAAANVVLREFAQRPNIYGKLTAFGLSLPNKPPPPPMALAAHKARLDWLWEAFGDDRVIGGAYSPESVALYRAYLATRPADAAEKLFWRNSASIYKWTPRRPNQPRLA
jgi:predicted TIM-barrel fold metal-dependent hydrolase